MTIVLTGLYRFIEKLGIVKGKKLSLENQIENLKKKMQDLFLQKS
jgi:predicted deacylase